MNSLHLILRVDECHKRAIRIASRNSRYALVPLFPPGLFGALVPADLARALDVTALSGDIGLTPDEVLPGWDPVKFIPPVTTMHTAGAAKPVEELAIALRTLHGDRLPTNVADGSGQCIGIVGTGVNPIPPLDRNLHERFSAIDGSDGSDDNGHETMVAGIITRAIDKVIIESFKCLNGEGMGSTFTVLRALRQVADNAKRLRIGIINMSLGMLDHSCDGHHQPCLCCQGVIELTRRMGITVVCAAGNDGPAGDTIGCPSNAHLAISAAAVGMDLATAWFSSRGPARCGDCSKPDLCSYGVNIEIPDHRGVRRVVSGTSFVSPCVAAVVGGIRQMMDLADPEPGQPEQIKSKLIESCIAAQSGDCDEVGAGAANLFRAWEVLGSTKRQPRQGRSVLLRIVRWAPLRRAVAAAAAIAILGWGWASAPTHADALGSAHAGRHVLVGRVISVSESDQSILFDDGTAVIRLPWTDASSPMPSPGNVTTLVVEIKTAEEARVVGLRRS